MAAVRRSSGTGVVVALVIFVLLAVVFLGCAVYFYQQNRLARQGVAANQAAFQQTVHQKFREAGWELSTQSPSELGFRYVQESYSEVTSKLDQAAQYEKAVRPLLGWQSVEGMHSDASGSPIQQEAETTYQTVRGLLAGYEDSYVALNDTVADLTRRNTDLSQRLEATKNELVETESQLNQQLNDAAEQYRQALAQLDADYTDMTQRHGRQREDATGCREELQEVRAANRTGVTELQQTAAKWREMYEAEIAGPGPREVLTAAGQVLAVYSEHDFVMIEGGADRNVQENDAFVVYSMNPDGTARKKGVVLVGQVHDHTSLATIAREDAYIVGGDSFVSQERWDQFHRAAEPIAQAVQEG